jgi:acyl-CoA thioester hydrolase
MAHTFRDRRRIEFYETDMAGIVHFSNYYRYMESAEHAFFRSLGLSLHRDEGEDMHGWARLAAGCEFRAPLHYMDEVEIELFVREKTNRTLTYEMFFRRLEDGRPSAAPCARGTLKVVHVLRSGGAMRATAMPAEVARAIEVAPADEPQPEPR